MTIEYKIIENLKLVYVRMSDIVTFPELMAHIKALSQDHRYCAPMRKLVDFRFCTQYKLSMEEGIAFAMAKAHLSDVFDNEQCALVAPKDIEYGMGRVHEAHTAESSIQTSVFRSFDDALNWLKIETQDNPLDLEKP